jgi:N-acetyl-anhydromuramyl-L-alanine amidase AmpD
MLNIQKYGDFKVTGKHKKKTKIILCHTSREVGEYLTSLKFRFNGKYDKIPHFVITKEGKILQLLPELGYSNYFTDENLNKTSILICLENLGWLEKKPLTNYYINWKGSIYKQQVYEKKWRDFFFWEPYTQSQIQAAAGLSLQIAETFQIEKKCIGHNVKVEGIKNFDGILTKSNLDMKYTDLSPSFDFAAFTKYIENEQYAQ